MKKIQIGLLGLGTVGSGVVSVIENHREKIMMQVGCDVEIKRILVHDIEAHSKFSSQYNLTTDVQTILNDDDISIVIEVMGGIEYTKTILTQAFRNKKSVVSANKDLIALYGEELSLFAQNEGCGFFYEAAVAGAVPIIQTLNCGLAIEHITEMTGILNGTTNYILTQMSEHHMSYAEALKEAQAEGFAEADPTGDVEGIDAARKVAILARIAYSMPFVLSDVAVRGITEITKNDMHIAKQLNCKIKLLGKIMKTKELRVWLSVEPTFVPISHPLAHIDNEFNAVIINAEATKEIMLSGPGAGSLPTANAVVSDVVSLIRCIHNGNVKELVVRSTKEKQLSMGRTVETKYIMIIKINSVSDVLANVLQILRQYHLHFSEILHNEICADGNEFVSVVIKDTTRAKMEGVIDTLHTMSHIQIENYYPML